VEAVLGLSVTPSAVGLVLVEGHDGDGATMDRDEFEVGSRGRASAVQTSEQAAAAVLRSEAIAATRGHRLHSIGVTWSDDADTEASLLLKSLSDSGFDNVVPVRLPEATEALARGIAEVIGYDTTAVCVIEPDTVIVLVVHSRDGAVQTAINHALVTEDDLIRWLSGVFTRADWEPEALVVVGSGGDDEIMAVLEDALSVPVFAPAEAQLALARGAALASAQNGEPMFSDEPDDWGTRADGGRRRGQIGQAAPMALLVAGVLTFVTSVSVAVSLQLAPKRESPAAQPRPAAKTSPETPAAVSPVPAVLPSLAVITPAPAAAPPPVEVPPVYSEAPVTVPDAPVLESAAPSLDEPAIEPPAGMPPAPSPEQTVPPVAPAPAERPGILSRIRDRLHGISRDDQGQAAPGAVPPPADVPPPVDVPPAPPPA
jgi:hypothetical protein